MLCDIQEIAQGVVNTLIGMGLPDSHVVACLDRGDPLCMEAALGELKTVMSPAQMLRITDELAYIARDAMSEADEQTPAHSEASVFYHYLLHSGRPELATAIHNILKEV